MGNHHTRYIAIAICFAAAVLGLVAMLILDVQDGETKAALIAAVGLLGVGLVDSALVESRRKDPEKLSVADDVRRNQ